MAEQETETLTRTPDPDRPSPLENRPFVSKSGKKAGHMRLARGDYSANQIGDLVTVLATKVQMSGLHPHAELVHVPTIVPPTTFALYAIEPMPQFDILITGQAKATFFSQKDVDEVNIIDRDGTKTVRVEQF